MGLCPFLKERLRLPAIGVRMLAAMRIVFMGTPEFAVLPLRRLVVNDYEVAAVYTREDKPGGRGRQIIISPVKELALSLGIPVIQPPGFKDPRVISQLAAFYPDIIVVAAYGRILPESVLQLPRYGCINIHPSLLPRHRGSSPIPSAILSGDIFTGTSIMLMDKGLDTGPVLAQAQTPIFNRDNTGSLTRRLSLLSACLVQEVLAEWTRGRIKPVPQDDGQTTVSSVVAKEDGRISWQLPAREIWRRVRAYNPWPGAYTTWQGRMLKITEAGVVSSPAQAAPGAVVALPRGGLGIVTGDGVLEVYHLQVEGKRQMSAAEFLRGQPQIIGAVLPC